MATSHHAADSVPIPDVVQLIVVAFVGLAGVAFAVVGSLLSFFVDQALVRETVSSGQITLLTVERTISEAEMAALGTDVANWLGIGLLVTGVVLTLFAGVYGLTQYRVWKQTDPATDRQQARQAAIVGAVVAAVLSFVPLSPLLGGGVAGYLSSSGGTDATRVGAVAGLLVAIPAVLLIGFTTVGLYAGLAVFAESSLRLLILGVMTASALFVLAVSVGLGGLGGYLVPVAADQ
jgi:hypothetical protein